MSFLRKAVKSGRLEELQHVEWDKAIRRIGNLAVIPDSIALDMTFELLMGFAIGRMDLHLPEGARRVHRGENPGSMQRVLNGLPCAGAATARWEARGEGRARQWGL